MSTITRRSTENGNAIVRKALSHNLCGWPAILPTRPPGVGDILYWTTPGAFQHGPAERTPDTPIHNP
jgi:hypothetical protein